MQDRRATTMNELIIPLIGFVSAVVVALIAAIPGLKALRRQKAQSAMLEEQITERVLTRANKEIETLTHKLAEMEREYTRKIDRIEVENKSLRLDNTRLRRRVRELENKLGEL